MQEYADPVIDWLDAGRGILARRFFREVRCPTLTSSPFSKPVLVLYATPKWFVYQGPVYHRARSLTCLPRRQLANQLSRQ